MTKPSLPILLGLAASLFFAITFIVNRWMLLDGGSWIWSASLRFFWMLPFFLLIVLFRGNLKGLFFDIRKKPFQWLLWSTVGFGLFYAPLTFAAAYSPSWLVAATWQVTIVAGVILSPLLGGTSYRQIAGSLIYSLIILVGIFIMQISYFDKFSLSTFLLGVLPVLVAAFAYPLGNRKMMQITGGKLDVYQRILGMLLCSMPVWILLSGYELLFNKVTPAGSQYLQTFVVALFSGVIATILFFTATDRVKDSPKSLAAVEATQSTEVIFTVAGELLLLSGAFPSPLVLFGMLLIIAGMLLHSYGRKKSVNIS